MDLLLHLIDVHELDIYDIPIAFITGQYMEYLRKAEEIDLNLSGDFLVMAGTLLVIKAQMLLPQRAQAEEDGETAVDPREELVEKLLAYRLYKESALEFKRLETSRTKIYFREVDEGRLLSMFPRPNPVGDLVAEDLHRAFQEMLRLMSARQQVITVKKDEKSVHDRMDYLLQNLPRHSRGIGFRQLMENCGDLTEVVTTFLALLELLSKGLIWVRQNDLFAEIYVGLRLTPAMTVGG